ncbi:MAG: tRNA lysidine(34) synthetase TilS [Bacillota bacterium]
MEKIKKVKEFIDHQGLLKNGDTVIVAVSGGPDSFTLIHMLHRLSHELNLKLIVAHLNHCLREEAGIEEAEVKKAASNWSLPFESKRVEIKRLKKEKGISEEEAGRFARYGFLFDTAKKYNASKIALGHHLDDQAETVLLNVLRGTGVDGLAGILPKVKRGSCELIRPLLCLRRYEIERYCFENNLRPFTDKSNLETDYTRNKIRLELIPELEKRYNPRVREALFGLAEVAAADRSFLREQARRKYLEMAHPRGNSIFFKRDELILLPAALKNRILHLTLKKYLSPGKIGRQHVEQVRRLAEKGNTGDELILPGGVWACLDYYNLIIYSSAYRGIEKINETPLKVPGKVVLPGKRAIKADLVDLDALDRPPNRCRAWLDYDLLPSKSLKVSSRWPGARFHPQGAEGGKKIKDFFIDQKVPREKRESVPLIVAGSEIIWVAGQRIAHPYRVTGQTERVLILEYTVPRMSAKKISDRI